MSFQQADQPHYRRWFIPGKAPAEFSSDKELAFEKSPEFFAMLDQSSGETFAIMLLTPPLKTQLRIMYPDFSVAGQGSHYRTGYYFGKEGPASLGGFLKTISAQISDIEEPK